MFGTVRQLFIALYTFVIKNVCLLLQRLLVCLLMWC